MIHAKSRNLAVGLLLCAITNVSAAAEHPVVKHKFNTPPSADLQYSIKAKQSGLVVGGSALLQWRSQKHKYAINTETRATLFGKILEVSSQGTIDAYGLAPSVFTEKRFRKGVTTTTFNRSTKLINFSASADTYPLNGGEQDRNSMIWQLIAIARAAPEKFKPESTWKFFVAGPRDAEAWSFKVIRREKINTPLGTVTALHLVKTPAADGKGQKVDIWLAPSFEWYPARLRFSDPDGDYIEQMLMSISKK